jgi:hypothetical protein
MNINNKIYSWGDSGSNIKFYYNFKIDAFGKGEYTIVDDNNIIAYFGDKEYDIKFSDDYNKFVSVRRGDLCVVNGTLINNIRRKVISFNLWGNNPTYTIGAIKNAEQAKNIYPDFECWFYIHQETVPQEIINELQKFDNVKIIFKNGDLNTCKPMMWRFEAIDDPEVEIIMSRDTDTRFWLREKLAVEEWLQSGKLFHIMRDHPHHNFSILGGMFGTRKILKIPSWINIINNLNQVENRDYDQTFLRDYIYPLIVNNSIIHATFNKKESHATNFPIDYNDNYNFVGEYVYFDESRSQTHIDILKDSL